MISVRKWGNAPKGRLPLVSKLRWQGYPQTNTHPGYLLCKPPLKPWGGRHCLRRDCHHPSWIHLRGVEPEGIRYWDKVQLVDSPPPPAGPPARQSIDTPSTGKFWRFLPRHKARGPSLEWIGPRSMLLSLTHKLPSPIGCRVYGNQKLNVYAHPELVAKTTHMLHCDKSTTFVSTCDLFTSTYTYNIDMYGTYIGVTYSL